MMISAPFMRVMSLLLSPCKRAMSSDEPASSAAAVGAATLANEEECAGEQAREGERGARVSRYIAAAALPLGAAR
jgi:hypothetical protein